jgi:hypothetical protein
MMLVERPKQWFGVPIYKWFKKELKEFYIEQALAVVCV